MKRYFAYLKKVLRHKYYVFLACLKLKVPLYLAVFHDMTKFFPREFFPYAKTFYDENGNPRDLRKKDGAYDPNNIGGVTEFSYAWISHQRNKHHWEAWVSIGDNGNLKVVPMPEKYIREMVADWVGAGIVYSGKADPAGFYKNNFEKMILHKDSRSAIENILMEYKNEN